MKWLHGADKGDRRRQVAEIAAKNWGDMGCNTCLVLAEPKKILQATQFVSVFQN